MGATTLGTVYDRVNSIVADQGFTRAKEPFSFDMQPAQQIDQTYYVESERDDTIGYFGGDQGESHRFQIWLARKRKTDPHAAARQLKVDMDLIEAALYGDSATFDYQVLDDSVTSDVGLPSENDEDHVVGELVATLDFDRSV